MPILVWGRWPEDGAAYDSTDKWKKQKGDQREERLTIALLIPARQTDTHEAHITAQHTTHHAHTGLLTLCRSLGPEDPVCACLRLRSARHPQGGKASNGT
ncbi:hypothetical protein MGYG_02671 [Nannizzia gypsea CBS 118893]|uniref:Uncharacterized protein n=1 Tax=Arthroderma gypseum (strain ATCC MYA-4604 / CBS 118893) TaxID=535722 RepID=E4UNQ5_ARTGP|nr:hypothetical protein MGYG_02671 [Nannizzia gypsea CBS 118893]EFQ99658.1 hypothetical protein MGYG_02671 [Nannizzia gypsea CBS 118893]